jgi:hypothetical protein
VLVWLHQSGHAQVANDCSTLSVKKDVPWLEVAVQDVLAVEVCESLC